MLPSVPGKKIIIINSSFKQLVKQNQNKNKNKIHLKQEDISAHSILWYIRLNNKE